MDGWLAAAGWINECAKWVVKRTYTSSSSFFPPSSSSSYSSSALLFDVAKCCCCCYWKLNVVVNFKRSSFSPLYLSLLLTLSTPKAKTMPYISRSSKNLLLWPIKSTFKSHWIYKQKLIKQIEKSEQILFLFPFNPQNCFCCKARKFKALSRERSNFMPEWPR